MVEHAVGERAVLERVEGEHLSGGGHLDRIVITDLGEDSAAAISALLTDQIDGIYELSESQAPMVTGPEHIEVYRANTALTAVARGKVDQEPFNDPRIMLAMRHSTDSQAVIERALRGNAGPGDHTHVSPIHPEWADLGPLEFNPERAAEILAEAGYPDGIDLEMVVKTQPNWELDVAQVMGAGLGTGGHPRDASDPSGLLILGSLDGISVQPDRLGPQAARTDGAWTCLSLRRTLERKWLLA